MFGYGAVKVYDADGGWKDVQAFFYNQHVFL
jgi:hypothetical protein